MNAHPDTICCESINLPFLCLLLCLFLMSLQLPWILQGNVDHTVDIDGSCVLNVQFWLINEGASAGHCQGAVKLKYYYEGIPELWTRLNLQKSSKVPNSLDSESGIYQATALSNTAVSTLEDIKTYKVCSKGAY